MARSFDQADGNSRVTAQILNGMSTFTYGTAAACVRHRSGGALGAEPVFCMGNTNAADDQDPINNYISSGNAYGCWDGGTDSIGSTTTTLNRWHVVAITKATGTVAPRIHTYVMTTATWTHVAGSTTTADAPSCTWILIPGYAGFTSHTDIAAIALWDKRPMSDGETERLAQGDWTRYAPDTYFEYPSGRDFPAEVNADNGRSRIRQTSGGTATRFNGDGPPGFRFSKLTRRR